MKNRRALSVLLTAALLLCLLSGCGGDYINIRVAYVSTGEKTGVREDSAAIVFETHRIARVDADRACHLALQLAASQPENSSLYTVLPQNLRINSIERRSNLITVDFNTAFLELDGIEETLARYCVAMTLCQFDGVEGVSISVEGESTGATLRPSDVVVSRAQLRIMEYDIDLYFPDETGEMLSRVNAVIKVSDASEPAVEAMRMLIQGQEGHKLVRHDGEPPVLLSVNVQNRICYVNLGRDFAKNSQYNDEGVSTSAYAIINTLCQFPNVDKVKILTVGTAAGNRLGLGTDEPMFPNPTLIS